MNEESFNHNVIFTLGGMVFEYDEQKNQININKHGIPFTAAARVFFDYDRIEMTDDVQVMMNFVTIPSVTQVQAMW